MSEKRKLPIDRPCSACSAGDTKMEYHDHRPPFRERVASPQATRPEPKECMQCGCDVVNGKCASQPWHIIDTYIDQQSGLVWTTKDGITAAQPAAETTPSYRGRNGVDWEAETEFIKWIDVRSEGTTPQAEREPHDGWMNAWLYANMREKECAYFWNPEVRKMAGDWADVRVERVTGRAVAPVETSDKCPSCGSSFRGEEKKEVDAVWCGDSWHSVETRLTAEQFHKTWPVSIFNESNPLACMFELMEAFRDKSEAELRAKAESAALRERERWIPVSEQMPEEGLMVLIVNRHANYAIAFREGNSWLGAWNGLNTGPTHWKALSAAPEAKS